MWTLWEELERIKKFVDCKPSQTLQFANKHCGPP